MPDHASTRLNARSDRLYDLATVLRSKNAGSLYRTFDIVFPDLPTYRRVVDSEVLTPQLVAELYNVAADEARIINFDAAHAIKITIPPGWAVFGRARRSGCLRCTAARSAHRNRDPLNSDFVASFQ
jgi:Domain of unknown function (DUF4387)